MTDLIIIVSLVLIAVIGGVSFFEAPAYKDGVWIVLGALTNCLSIAVGAKFGMAIPGKENGKQTEPELNPSRGDVSGSAGSSVGSAGDAHQ